jgi:hypothetical protein
MLTSEYLFFFLWMSMEMEDDLGERCFIVSPQRDLSQATCAWMVRR